MIPNKKLLEDFEASCRSLADQIKLFDGGSTHAYRPVAVELRKLVAEARLEKCLAYKILGDFELNQNGTARMVERIPSLRGGPVFSLPGQVTVSSAGTQLGTLFPAGAKRVPLSKWRREPFLAADITVYDFVKSVADREGAHADDEYDETLKRLVQIKLGDESARAHIVVSVGRYLLNELEAQFQAKTGENSGETGAR